MTTYLLDTNACIALINGTQADVRRRFQRAVARDSVMLLSSIVAFELWYGIAKSQRKEGNAQRLEAFLAGPWSGRRSTMTTSVLLATSARSSKLLARRLAPTMCCSPVRHAAAAQRSSPLTSVSSGASPA
jgi:predicted nucleic acid-binding protein